jgi:hypothetical protein
MKHLLLFLVFIKLYPAQLNQIIMVEQKKEHEVEQKNCNENNLKTPLGKELSQVLSFIPKELINISLDYVLTKQLYIEPFDQSQNGYLNQHRLNFDKGYKIVQQLLIIFQNYELTENERDELFKQIGQYKAITTLIVRACIDCKKKEESKEGDCFAWLCCRMTSSEYHREIYYLMAREVMFAPLPVYNDIYRFLLSKNSLKEFNYYTHIPSEHYLF